GDEPEGPEDEPVGLTVTDAVDGIRPLGPHVGLPQDLVITHAVNAIADLANDIALDSDHPITEAIEQQRREDAISGTFGSDAGPDFPAKPYEGGGLTVNYHGNGEALIRSLIYQDEVYVELSNLRGKIEDWGVTLANGGAMPDWITMPASDLVLIDRPADVNHVHLEILGRTSKGELVTISVRIDLRTGEIIRDGPVEVAGVPTNADTTFAATSGLDDGLSASMERLARAETSQVSSLFKV
ncbi:MAG: hypothetical protein AAFU56_07525, partial [Pseudomonadota bacterium]